jgi:amino acid transporter
VFLFIPIAAVVHYCARLWPLEGGVYQWTRHAFGPFAGFISAWNFFVWSVLASANIGILTATNVRCFSASGVRQRNRGDHDRDCVLTGPDCAGCQCVGFAAKVAANAMGAAIFGRGKRARTG